MNRRDIFKGMAGAGAAAALSQQRGIDLAPTYMPINEKAHQFLRNTIPAPSVDSFQALKSAATRHAAKQRELLQDQLERKGESLSRMKSVSEAYKHYMFNQYRKETYRINDAYEQFCNAIWSSTF